MLSDGARTPEELEVLLEDAFILSDAERVISLFEPNGILVSDRDHPESPAAFTARTFSPNQEVVRPASTRILATNDLAISVGEGVNLSRRGPDGSWRIAISVLKWPPTHQGEI